MSGKKGQQTPSDTGDDTWAEQNTNRGGDEDGCCPDYEKNQSSPNSDKDFDNSKSSW